MSKEKFYKLMNLALNKGASENEAEIAFRKARQIAEEFELSADDIVSGATVHSNMFNECKILEFEFSNVAANRVKAITEIISYIAFDENLVLFLEYKGCTRVIDPSRIVFRLKGPSKSDILKAKERMMSWIRREEAKWNSN